MPTQLSDAGAVLVSETAATSYYVGGPFNLGSGPFTDLNFTASDDDTEFAAFGAQYSESFGAGRQTGTLTDGSGGTFGQGLASLEDVLTITDPSTGQEILVGRVSIRVDTGDPGGGAQTQDFYIFSAPIDPNVVYSVTAIDYTPGSSAASSYQYSDFASSNVVCFAAGTLIRMRNGLCPVELIRSGDLVQTADNGLREVLWTGSRRATAANLRADPSLYPVRIAPGLIGNTAPLLVSQQHRLLIGDRLIKAKFLVDLPRSGARIARGRREVSYHHLLLDRHEILFANGAPAESLFMGPISRAIVGGGGMGKFHPPAIRHEGGPFGGLCRADVRRRDLVELTRCRA